MRLTELLAVHNGDVGSNDPRITHLERLPKRKWLERYEKNTVAGYDKQTLDPA